MRVLAVDDDAAIRLIVSHVLKARGHAVTAVADGAAAAAALAEAPTDVVLMDVQLGQEDGIELAARLLAGITDPPRLVFLTGTAHRDGVRRMRALHPAGIIEKPFDPTTLPALLEQLTE